MEQGINAKLKVTKRNKDNIGEHKKTFLCVLEVGCRGVSRDKDSSFQENKATARCFHYTPKSHVFIDSYFKKTIGIQMFEVLLYIFLHFMEANKIVACLFCDNIPTVVEVLF